MSALSHVDEAGRARMVDVSEKPLTARRAVAVGTVRMTSKALELALGGETKKGDVITVAELAGVMGAKRTSELIPLCHPLSLSNIAVKISPARDGESFLVKAIVKTTGATGVEMEALTAVSIACLTLYDMLKSVDREMTIDGVHLVEKSGGASGPFQRPGP